MSSASDEKVYRIDFRPREMETRYIREGSTRITESRTIIHNEGSPNEVGEWWEVSRLLHYYDSFERKPSIWDRLMGFIGH